MGALPKFPLLPALALVAACASIPNETQRAREQIASVIAAGIEASRRGDVEAFIARLAPDFAVEQLSGRVATREDVRQAHLARARNGPQTMSITTDIERLELSGDEARVWTQQRWERRVTPAGTAVSRLVVTTQRHEENWRRREGRWEPYRIKELGGDVFVDGVRQAPQN